MSFKGDTETRRNGDTERTTGSFSPRLSIAASYPLDHRCHSTALRSCLSKPTRRSCFASARRQLVASQLPRGSVPKYRSRINLRECWHLNSNGLVLCVGWHSPRLSFRALHVSSPTAICDVRRLAFGFASPGWHSCFHFSLR